MSPSGFGYRGPVVCAAAPLRVPGLRGSDNPALCRLRVVPVASSPTVAVHAIPTPGLQPPFSEVATQSGPPRLDRLQPRSSWQRPYFNAYVAGSHPPPARGRQQGRSKESFARSVIACLERSRELKGCPVHPQKTWPNLQDCERVQTFHPRCGRRQGLAKQTGNSNA